MKEKAETAIICALTWVCLEVVATTMGRGVAWAVAVATLIGLLAFFWYEGLPTPTEKDSGDGRG